MLSGFDQLLSPEQKKENNILGRSKIRDDLIKFEGFNIKFPNNEGIERILKEKEKILEMLEENEEFSYNEIMVKFYSGNII